MNKYYIAPNKRGRLIKIVEDVRIPISNKMTKLGVISRDYLIRPALIARFTNEKICREFLEAYKAMEQNKVIDIKGQFFKNINEEDPHVVYFDVFSYWANPKENEIYFFNSDRMCTVAKFNTKESFETNLNLCRDYQTAFVAKELTEFNVYDCIIKQL